MGKYFSNNTDLSKYNITIDNSIDTSKLVIPSTNNLTNPLSNETKEKLAIQRTPLDAINEDDHINLVKEQTLEVTKVIQQYSKESKEEFKQHFERFAPAELFEKINQMIYVVTQLANKVTTLETIIKNSYINNETSSKSSNEKTEFNDLQETNIMVTEPQRIPTITKKSQSAFPSVSEVKKELLNKHNPTLQNVNKKAMPSIDEVRQQLADIQNGKNIKSLPSEDYNDESLNLEELFPDLENDAYQAAYASMAKSKEKLDKTDVTPTPGKMKGITGF